MDFRRMREALRMGCTLNRLEQAVTYCFDMGSDPPPPDPQIGAAAKENAAIAKEALDFNKQVYAENKPRQAKLDALSTRVATSMADSMDANTAHAQDQWDYYQKLFQPVERQMVADATQYDSPDNLERVAADAGSQVGRQYDLARRNADITLRSRGIDPSSGNALALSRAMQVDEAASTAGAMNQARTSAKDKAISLRAGAANFGRNMPNTASNAYSLAQAGGNNAMNATAAPMSTANQNAALMNSGFGTAGNLNQSAGNLALGSYNAQMQGWGAEQAANAAMLSGLGQAAGMAYGFNKR